MSIYIAHYRTVPLMRSMRQLLSKHKSSITHKHAKYGNEWENRMIMRFTMCLYGGLLFGPLRPGCSSFGLVVPIAVVPGAARFFCERPRTHEGECANRIYCTDSR